MFGAHSVPNGRMVKLKMKREMENLPVATKSPIVSKAKPKATKPPIVPKAKPKATNKK